MEEQEQQSQPEKVNPFKELPKPTQPQPKHAAKEKHKESKEFTIKLRPWKMVKGLFFLILLVGVFMAGRYTAGGDSLALPDLSKYFSSDAGPSGLVTGDTEAADEPEAVVEAAPAEEEKTEDTQLADDGTTGTVEETEEVQEEVEDKPEKFVTEGYEKVTLSVDGVYKDWKGTWGKIIGVKYTITNHEKGTVKPHHFTMIVEGYEDGEKYFDVAYGSQRVKAGQTVSDEAAVSGGFAYSPVTIPDGDLSKVRISLVLLDEDSDVMAAAAQEVDLSGE